MRVKEEEAEVEYAEFGHVLDPGEEHCKLVEAHEAAGAGEEESQVDSEAEFSGPTGVPRRAGKDVSSQDL